MNPADLHLFFEDLVRELRSRGILCAIASGLACVGIIPETALTWLPDTMIYFDWLNK